MHYLFISNIINAIVIYYLIVKTDRLQEEINELKKQKNHDTGF